MNFKIIVKKMLCYGALMRVDKPVGILLLLWPTLMALAIAGVGQPDWTIVLIFVIGTVLMRSAGCVLNDIADSQFDGQVERTKLRPLVTQQVTKKEAYFLASGLVILAFLLVTRLNTLTIIWSLFALIFAVVYPYTKRFLAIPQAFLGIAFGFGIPMAFAALTGEVPMVAWLLMLANMFWAIAYDTIYAMVDREDDLRIGIRSSAITFGRYDVLAVMFCYAMSLLLLVMLGLILNMGIMFYLALTMALGLVFRQYRQIQTRDRALCFQVFKQSHWFGFLILLGCIAKYADSLMAG